MNFDFSVRRLSGVRPVKVRIYDLGGRLVRVLDIQRPQVAGAYSIAWAADDEAGQVVAPGIYILRLAVDTDSNAEVAETAAQRALYVAY